MLTAKPEEELQRMLDHLVVTGRGYGMQINSDKSKVMKASKDERTVRILLIQAAGDNVSQFRCLESLLTRDAHCTKK